MMQCGCDCGVLAPPSVIGTPGAVLPFSLVPLFIPAANIVAGWDARDLSASPVALWPDASGNGFDLTQAVGASQPTWGAATGPNGQPAVLFDGVNDFMSNALLDRPAPGTQPTFYWAVLRQVTWTNTHRLATCDIVAGGLRMALANTGVTPAFVMADNVSVNSNNALTLNSYRRLEVLYHNATSDYIKVGSTATTGANAGNIDPAATFTLAAIGLGLLPSNIEVCEWWIFNALPSAAQLAALDAYAAARYGAGVLT